MLIYVVNLLLLLLENFQRSDVSPPFAIYLSFCLSSKGINLLLLLFREGKQFAARLCTIYTGREKIQMEANTMTYTVALPFSTTGVGGSNGQTTTTIVRSRLTTTTTAVTVQHFTGSDFFRTTFSSHSATDKRTEI